MTAYLLDVNVLIALSWPEHMEHMLAQRWFAKHRGKGWATCPLAQAGFVRIVSNPVFSSRSVSVHQAIEGLVGSLRDQAHQFWPDSISLADAVRLVRGTITGHQQITDAYLVALAMHNRGKLATLDRGIQKWAPEGSVELIS
ncbi:MAG TPA: TA system VapC family ribonuclease toxin [Candidatus Dormibacteraeota bacterium]|jgi:toxin-antitoxin system PIN domain toxin|nr:TA system VapC family ribonuclease toxin [Candidatus Dormibacteraeota bacterium]